MYINWNLVSVNYRSQTLQTHKVLGTAMNSKNTSHGNANDDLKVTESYRIRRPGGHDSLPQALLSALSTQLGSFHFS